MGSGPASIALSDPCTTSQGGSGKTGAALLYENELIRRTDTELIVQGALVSEAFRRDYLEAAAAGGETAPAFEKAAACAACHGQNGISLSPSWPTLAGQHEEYLVHALNQYRDGSRKDPVMSPMAAPLTDEDVKLLAKFYSSLKGLETTTKAD